MTMHLCYDITLVHEVDVPTAKDIETLTGQYASFFDLHARNQIFCSRDVVTLWIQRQEVHGD